MRPPIDNGSILITGASSGIGKQLAMQLAVRARSITLVARREAKLREVKETLLGLNDKLVVEIVPCDLSKTENIDQLLDTIGEIDVLINNAGMGDLRFFETTDWAKLELMLSVNITALTYLTRRLLPAMLARGSGGILNIGSSFGLVYMPGAACYAGSKHYVTAFTDTLRMELRGTGIVVSQSCPGPVETEFLQISGNPYGHDTPGIIQISAEKCARQSLRGFSRGRAIIRPGFVIHCLVRMGELAPRVVNRAMYSPWVSHLRKNISPPEVK